MGDNALDLYSDDIENNEFPTNDEYNEDADLYDDVMVTSNNNVSNSEPIQEHPHEAETNGNNYNPNMSLNHLQRRHQLYIGNLTWWTTDQDIGDAVSALGVNDFQEVKFFENRTNGQSKGFCVITLGSENSMRMVMENLPKKELNGQNPMVTLPTKQALNQFEAQQKTRPTPPAPPNQKGGMGMMGPQGPMMQQGGMPPQGMPPHQRMMNPNGPPMRGPMPMQGPPGGMQGPPMRMQGPMHQGPPMGPNQQGMPPRFQNQWNGPPRGPPNGMNRPPGPPHPNQGMNMPPNGPPGQMNMQRPQMNMPPNGPMRGPRPDWNRPPMHGPPFNQQQGPGPNPMGGPPIGPRPPQMAPHGPPQQSPHGPAPHVNPAFFNQNPQGIPPQGHPQGPPMAPSQPMGGGPPNGPHFNQQRPGPGGNMWPGQPNKMPGVPFEQPPSGMTPQISETEFEEIMNRNRTVSSSAIARAVSDAAAGEFSSAIETLATAISLIKQSKVANDDRCKILINSLQDTLQGVETKSYNRRERSRSRERSHRRQRRERSGSRYRDRERSRERDRDREHRDRDKEGRYYGEYRDHGRERSRSRDRGTTEHYREESNSRSRRNKSPEASGESVVAENSKRNFYDERYRSERDRDRDRESRREKKY